MLKISSYVKLVHMQVYFGKLKCNDIRRVKVYYTTTSTMQNLRRPPIIKISYHVTGAC